MVPVVCVSCIPERAQAFDTLPALEKTGKPILGFAVLNVTYSFVWMFNCIVMNEAFSYNRLIAVLTVARAAVAGRISFSTIYGSLCWGKPGIWSIFGVQLSRCFLKHSNTLGRTREVQEGACR